MIAIIAGMEPAASIIRLFGGAAKVASILGKHPTRVYRWTYPADGERKGGGGLVPSRDQVALLTYARANGVDLRPEDFFSAERLHVVTAAHADAPAQVSP